MKKKTINYGIIAGALVVFIIGYMFLTQGTSATDGEFDELAKCMASKGVVMYGTNWCSFCSRQKEAFGTSFQYIEFVDCEKDSAKCSAQGITRYPTWEINGQKYPGLKSLQDLSQLSGCNLN